MALVCDINLGGGGIRLYGPGWFYAALLVGCILLYGFFNDNVFNS